MQQKLSQNKTTINEGIFDISKMDIDSIEGVQGGVTSLQEAYNRNDSFHEGSFNGGKYSLLIEKLEEIKVKTGNQNPVKYLIYLHYVKDYSIAKISKHLSDNLNVKWIAKTLGKNIDKFFNWKRNGKVVKKTIKRTKDDIIKILERIAKNKRKENINRKKLDNFRNNVERIRYILDSKGYIIKDDFENTILEISKKYGQKVTIDAVNNILVNEGFPELKLNKGRLSEFRHDKSCLRKKK